TKGAGLADTRENCWKFFIDRVRRNLKVILCFSPVGSTLRVRARKFPALVNCTTIDWFMEWPKEALESVSARFLAEVEVLSKKLVKPLSFLMAFMHTTVNSMSQQYLLNERRYNYTTPKSFLELISLYSKLLTGKNKEINDKIGRLQNGLQKLVSCSEQVAVLKKQLAVQDKVVQQKNAAATLLIDEVAVEKDKVQKEQAIATEEARKVRIIEEDVTIKQKVCEEDLAKAEPALAAAKEALNTLNK
ncbi:dynein beta chain, ciliary-like, partial [Halyomorpha halys]